MILLAAEVPHYGPTTPRMRRHIRGLVSSPVARHYWGNHCLFSLPLGTKMFQFPRFASILNSMDSSPSDCWVVPFGNLGVKGHLRLTRAYRSLSRPSSPPRAKASTGRPKSLSLMIFAHTFSCN